MEWRRLGWIFSISHHFRGHDHYHGRGGCVRTSRTYDCQKVCTLAKKRKKNNGCTQKNLMNFKIQPMGMISPLLRLQPGTVEDCKLSGFIGFFLSLFIYFFLPAPTCSHHKPLRQVAVGPPWQCWFFAASYMLLVLAVASCLIPVEWKTKASILSLSLFNQNLDIWLDDPLRIRLISNHCPQMEDYFPPSFTWVGSVLKHTFRFFRCWNGWEMARGPFLKPTRLQLVHLWRGEERGYGSDVIWCCPLVQSST